MAHAIDMTTGKAAVFVTGEAAWHRLGVVVSEAQTSEQAIQLAGLDWTVGKYPIQAIVNGLAIDVPDKFAIIREDTGAALGVVGNQYRPFQNVEAFDFMDAIVGEKLAMFETAGSLHDGRRVWMMARIPKELRVGGDDVINPYVLLTNSHDGSGSLRMLPTSVRVVCQNTLNLALRRGNREGISLPHFSKLEERVAEARKELGIILRRFDSFQEEIEALASVSLTETQVRDYVQSIFPVKAPKKVKAHEVPQIGYQYTPDMGNDNLLDSILESQSARREMGAMLVRAHQEELSRAEKNNAKILEQVLANFHNERNSLPGIEGTAWAAYNAVSEYCDHQMNSRTDDSRLQSIWFGRADQIKQEAYAAALELVQGA